MTVTSKMSLQGRNEMVKLFENTDQYFNTNILPTF